MDTKDQDTLIELRTKRWAVQLLLDRNMTNSTSMKDNWKILSHRHNRSSSGHIVHVMKEELRREGLL